MTSPELIKVAAIKAILEAIEDGEAKDAALAIEMIRGLIGPEAKKA